jgi:glycosyltransferase involved in cell wall biosynthesis
MIIGIDASRANNQEKTGVEWYAYHLIQKLKKITPENIRVVLYSREKLIGELPENWENKVLSWKPRRFWTQIRLSFEMLTNSPDILFIPSHVFPIIHPKKTVMTIHDVAARKFPNSYSRFSRWYTLWSAKFALKNLWKIIVPSEFTKEELASFGFPTKKVEVIPHGYDKNYKVVEDKKKINSILKKYKIKKPFVMTIGRLEEKKNTVNIIKSFNKIRIKNKELKIKLLLVGQDGYGFEKVEEEIKNSNYKEDIIRPGWVDEEDLVYLMNATEVFLFPSLYEGFGLPVLEAFACGTPVLASRGSSLEEVGGEAGIYVNSSNVVDIAKKILNLVENKEIKNKKIELGLERVKNFSWAKCARETLEELTK